MTAWRNRILEAKSQTRDALIAYCRAESPTWAEAELGPWADSKQQVRLNVLQLVTDSRTPWQETARRITRPVLLITADPDAGAIVTPEIAQEAAGLWQTGKVARIDGAGHSIHREQFEPYMQAVTGFLAKVTQA